MTCLLHEIGMGKKDGYAISQKQQFGEEQVRSDGVREGKGQKCKLALLNLNAHLPSLPSLSLVSQ